MSKHNVLLIVCIILVQLLRGSLALVSSSSSSSSSDIISLTCSSRTSSSTENLNELCLTNTSAPFPLYMLLAQMGLPPNRCAAGFYCPNLNSSDPCTWPTLCTPTSDCQLDRLKSDFCEAQGTYDPILCPKKYYCPSETEKYICPEGYYCPMGRSSPIECPALSSCPEGSDFFVFYGSVLYLLFIDGAVLVGVWTSRKYFARRDRQRSRKFMNLEGMSVTMPLGVGDDRFATLPKYTQTLCRGFDRARHDYMVSELAAGHFANMTEEQVAAQRFLLFEFKDLSLWIPAPKSTVAGGGGAITAPAPPSAATAGGDTEASASSATPRLSPAPSPSLSPSPAPAEGGGVHRNTVAGGGVARTEMKKCILAGVTGAVRPGKVTAIMGPSGCGKTTFLHTMMGKLDSKWSRHGELKINGMKNELSKYKRIVGYVPQDDIMHRSLTVYENIYFSACLRLPRNWTPKQREAHVQAVIAAMQLTHVHDTKIGDEHERGVSGGQRKRASIGMELAAAPSALFLDEPTSGLDSSSALDVCRVLSDVARNTHMTVAMVIHQPRVEIWESLDQLLILGKGGRTVYEGPQRYCQLYFQRHLACDIAPYENPADAIMDAIGAEGENYIRAWARDGPATLAALTATAVAVPRSVKAKKVKFIADAKRRRGGGGVRNLQVPTQQAAAAEQHMHQRTKSMQEKASSSSSSSSAASASATDVIVVAPKDEAVTTPTQQQRLQQQQTADVGLIVKDKDELYGEGVEESEEEEEDEEEGEEAEHGFSVYDVPSDDDDNNAGVRNQRRKTQQPPQQLPKQAVSGNVELTSASGAAVETTKLATAAPLPSSSLTPSSSSATPLASSSSAAASPTSVAAKFQRTYPPVVPDPNGVSHARGAAPFPHQFLLFMRRSFLQQLASPLSLATEIFVGLAAGLVMGVAAKGTYQGVLIAPYTFLSPMASEFLVPQIGMFVCMSISVAAASAGVRVYNEEEVIYWREASSGINTAAYFWGVSVATLFRQFLDALHFSFIYHILSNTMITFEWLLLLVTLQFFGTYGLGALMSQMTRRENGALVAVVVALIMSVFNGYADLPKFLQVLTPGFWMTEAFFTIFTEEFETVMQVEAVSAPLWGFTTHQLGVDVVVMIVVGVSYRILAHMLMTVRHQDKKR